MRKTLLAAAFMLALIGAAQASPLDDTAAYCRDHEVVTTVAHYDLCYRAAHSDLAALNAWLEPHRMTVDRLDRQSPVGKLVADCIGAWPAGNWIAVRTCVEDAFGKEIGE